MTFRFLGELFHPHPIVFPSTNIQLSVAPETNIIDSEPAISVEESPTGFEVEEQTESQSLNDESTSSSSSTAESISNPDEKLVGSNTTTITTDSNSSLFSFDIGNYLDDMIITLIVFLSSVSIYLVIIL